MCIYAVVLFAFSISAKSYLLQTFLHTGAVSSIGMEVIQQAPFLPLTKSLMETIAALNSSQLAATQQSIAEYLARTYQYVHVPKMNVIHDCLGILIKERRIYHTGNGYFVSSHSPFDKPADSPNKENGHAHGTKESRCVACEVISKGKSSKADKAKKKSKGREKESAKGKENGKVKTSEKEVDKPDSKIPVNSVEVKEGNEVKSSPQMQEPASSGTMKPPSETASETGSEGTSKKAKKQKKGVFNQISCFIKGKTLSAAEVCEETKQEQTMTSPSPPPQLTDAPQRRPAPLATQEDISLSRVQFRNKRTLSAPADNPSLVAPSPVPRKEVEEASKRELKRTVPNTRELARSKSFVASEKRPQPVLRSNSFTATSTKVARQISTESAPGAWDKRLRYGDIIRNDPARRTIHISRPSSCNIGIVRPLDTTQQRPLSRSNSIKKETPRKKGGSLSPPSTPRMPLAPSSTPRLKENSNRSDITVMRSKSFTEPRMANRQISRRQTIGPHYESPLQQLLARNTPAYTSPPGTGVRVTIAPKGRYYAPIKHSPVSPKRTPPSSPSRRQPKQHVVSSHAATPKEQPQTRKDCSSPICCDTSMRNENINNCLCNGVVSNVDGTARFAPVFHPNYNYHHDGVSSEHICIEEMTSTSASEVTLIADRDRYAETRADNEGKPQGLYKFTDEGINDSLTFIGII